MTAASVSANNTRLDDAEAGTGWESIGSGQGGAAEGSFPYQGNNLFNRKVTSSTGAGVAFVPTNDSGSAQDMTAAATSTYMAKLIVTDYGGLQATNGVVIRIGSSSTNYYDFVVAGSSSPVAALGAYPPKGGIVVVPVDPNISAYRDATGGSGATLTAVDYFGVIAAFATASAKSENVGLDAVDIGTGLTLTGGTSPDPAATFQTFLDNDEDNTNNRYGYCTSANGIFQVFGTLTIGDTSQTVFTDTGQTVVFPDGMFAAGWSGIAVDLQATNTAVSITSCNFLGLGDTTTEDTRPELNVTSTTGTATFDACSFNAFRAMVLTSAVTFTSNTVTESEGIVQAGATITDCVFSGSPVATGVAMMTSSNPQAISGCSFESGGNGHAIEITTAGTYNFNGNTFSGYSGTGNSAPIYNNSGGAVTLNIGNNGDTPTVRDGVGASTTVNNTVTVRVTAKDVGDSSAISGARIYLTAAAGGPLSEGTIILNNTSNGSGIVEDTGFNFVSNQPVTGKIRKSSPGDTLYKTSPIAGTITASGFDVDVFLNKDQ